MPGAAGGGCGMAGAFVPLQAWARWVVLPKRNACMCASLLLQGCVKLLDAARGLRTVRTLKLQHTKVR